MGFAVKTAACREFTSIADNPESELIAWIGGHLNWFICPVRNHVILISTASKYRYRQHQETDQNLGL